jgi:hypothetical protein
MQAIIRFSFQLGERVRVYGYDAEFPDGDIQLDGREGVVVAQYAGDENVYVQLDGLEGVNHFPSEYLHPFL